MNGTWIPDNWGLQNGEEVGGDCRVTDGHSRRYLLAAENGEALSRVVDGETLYSMFTIYWYAQAKLDHDSEDGLARDSEGDVVIWLTVQTESLVCTDLGDPGGTERWSDYQDDDMDIFYESIEAAEKGVLHEAEMYTTELANRDIGWNGLTPWEEGDHV